MSAGGGAVRDVLLQPEPSTLKARSVQGAAATAAAQAIRVLLQFGSVILLARLLAPEDFGLVAMVLPLIGLIGLFNEFGLGQAVVQRREITLGQVSALFWANLCLSSMLALLVAAAAPLVALLYAEPAAAPVTASLAALLLLGGLATQPMAVLARQMRFCVLAAIDVASSLLAIAAGVGGALLGFGHWALVAMPVAGAATSLVLAWGCAGWWPRLPRREAGVLPLLRFGGGITGFNLVNHLAYSLDKVLIGMTSGATALGLYERAGRLSGQPLWQAIHPVGRVALPLLSRLQEDPVRYRAAYLRMLGAILLATTPGFAAAVALAEPVVVTLLGGAWREAAPILAWMALGALGAPLGISLGWLFVTQGRARAQLVWGSASAGVMILAYLAGLRWGAVGVAAAAAIANWLLATPLLAWAACRSGPVCLPDLAGTLWPFLPAAAAAAAAAWLLETLSGPLEGPLLGLALPVAYGAAGMALACLPRGRRLLREVLALRREVGRISHRA